ncbi:tRNA (adenosine(37)-N6)-dimethylallyltransferase MiaA [Brochothrix thermosphacta]|uniref:tRNA (adenosine(37)-N6)-dimethylallyltransferase MiaA n=1 Tax=Brochothrix thermosphacta TaxID=2756 RepID=UPI00083F8667|nr:tRNA (adenosine(37)-N6)-dimethylallyltransferase MiaA [Brochothrix thermosphacta]ODJ60190.1 tRNA (adenosine(37)-N6)-dimethylallyltransferase MiaA [Brochothrix thermosphacta]
MSKRPVVALIGPTAVGKTVLSLHLAQRFGSEIISGDSMQIYREMNIGTAKASTAEQKQVRHHMIDIVDPTTNFDVSQFVQTARQEIDAMPITALPLIVGGTGLYIQSVLFDFKLGQAPDNPIIRAKYEQLLSEQGKEALFAELEANDPVSATLMHPNNTRRVIRALEVTEVTGIPFSQQQPEPPQAHYPHLIIGLNTERERLYERINQRVDQMMSEGLVAEVKALQSKLTATTAYQAIGYKEILDYLDGRCSYEAAVDLIKQRSRHYAKRQLTWFNNRMNVSWLDAEDPELLEKATKLVENFINNTKKTI